MTTKMARQERFNGTRAELTRAALCYLAYAVAVDGWGIVQVRGQDAYGPRVWPWAEDAWVVPDGADDARDIARQLLIQAQDA